MQSGSAILHSWLHVPSVCALQHTPDSWLHISPVVQLSGLFWQSEHMHPSLFPHVSS